MENQTNLNQPVTIAEMSRLFSENNQTLIPVMRKMIKDNNDVLIPLMGNMIDEKIKANNTILIPLVGKIMDEKIKANNEYIFAEFNNQTERILSLFKGVIRVRRDGTFAVGL